MKDNKQLILDFCRKAGITEEQFYGRERIEGNLDLRDFTSVPAGFCPNVGGYLFLGNLTSLPEGTTFNVGVFLFLRNLTSLPEGTTFNVGGNLFLESLTSLPEGTTFNVGGNLYLGRLTSLPEGTTFNVGGNLYLESLTSLPEGTTFNVGGKLFLRNLTSLPEGTTFNVGGDLYLRNERKYIGADVHISNIYYWRDKTYIKADGIFTEVISHRGNVYKVKRIARKEVKYLVTDGAGKWAHGDTLDEARKDLVYKIASRDKSKYENLTLDSTLTFEEAIECYRVITGACAMGTKNFVENILGAENHKEQYTIKEIAELTKGHYSSETFAEFFKRG